MVAVVGLSLLPHAFPADVILHAAVVGRCDLVVRPGLAHHRRQPVVNDLHLLEWVLRHFDFIENRR